MIVLSFFELFRISVPIPKFAHLMIELLCLLFLVALFQVLLSTSLAPALFSSEKSKGNLSSFFTLLHIELLIFVAVDSLLYLLHSITFPKTDDELLLSNDKTLTKAIAGIILYPSVSIIL